MSNEKKGPRGCLGYIGDEILPEVGIQINHEMRMPMKQPQMEHCKMSFFFHPAHLKLDFGLEDDPAIPFGTFPFGIFFLGTMSC